MARTLLGLLALLALASAGCDSTWPEDWSQHLGGSLALEGSAANSKMGAVLREGSRSIAIDGLEAWPEEVLGRRVRVEGVVIERDDLPPAGDPSLPSAGVDGSTRRYLLSEVRWEPAD